MVPIAQFARFVQGQCYQIIAILKKWSIVPQLIFLHSNFTLYKCTIFIIVAVFESTFTEFHFGKLDLLSNFIFQGVGSGNNNLVHRERQKIISLLTMLLCTTTIYNFCFIEGCSKRRENKRSTESFTIKITFQATF